MLMTPQLLYGTSPDAPEDHSLPEFSEAGTGVGERPVYAGGVSAATPEHLCGGAGAWPDHAVEVDGIHLLAPGVDFAAEDHLCLVGC